MGDGGNAALGNQASGAVRDECGQPAGGGEGGAWAGAELVICADNDRQTEGNPGVTYATAAAKATGARLIVPDFPEGEAGSDFNDLAAIRRKGARHGE